MISILLAKKILSLFLIMAMGVVLVRTKLLKPSDSKSISVVALYLIMPCVILTSFQVDYTPELLSGLLLALASAVLIHITTIVLAKLLSGVLKFDPVESASIIYSNAGNLIIPLVTTLLGPEWVFYTSAFISVQLFLIWSHGKMTVCGERSIDLKKVLLNSNMISIFVGVFLFVTGLRFPSVVQDSLQTVSGMIGPACMIVTGMLIGGMDLKKVFGYRRVWLITGLRLVAVPLFNVALLRFSGLANLSPNGTTILLITLLASITPSAATITQMAQVYGRDAEYASAINVVTTLLCVVTMPFIVFLYQL